MKTKTIKQFTTVNTTPHEVYEALTDSQKHASFTHSAARISPNVGGRFTAYDRYIEGKNVELVPDKKIVQQWRAEEAEWPKDHYSIVTFSLRPIKEGTRVDFVQTGVPEAHAADVAQGWHDYYWKPMKDFFQH